MVSYTVQLKNIFINNNEIADDSSTFARNIQLAYEQSLPYDFYVKISSYLSYLLARAR